MAHGGRARGEMGGGTREQCGSNKRCTDSPFLGSLTTGLIWLVTRVGGWGEAWGGGPWRAGKEGDGGGRWPMEGGERGWGGSPKSSVGAIKGAPFWHPTTGLIWLVTRGGDGGRRGEVAHGGRARGEMGGHQRAVWEQQKVRWFPVLGSLKNPTTGLMWLVTRVGGWGEAWGGGPRRAGKGET